MRLEHSKIHSCLTLLGSGLQKTFPERYTHHSSIHPFTHSIVLARETNGLSHWLIIHKVWWHVAVSLGCVPCCLFFRLHHCTARPLGSGSLSVYLHLSACRDLFIATCSPSQEGSASLTITELLTLPELSVVHLHILQFSWIFAQSSAAVALFTMLKSMTKSIHSKNKSISPDESEYSETFHTFLQTLS